MLLFSSGAMAWLGENSNLSLDKFLQKSFDTSDKKISELDEAVSTSKLSLGLNLGELIVDIKKLDKESTFEVKTALGVAGVRGTAFKLSASISKSTLSVVEGNVEYIQSTRNKIEVLKSEQVVIEKNAAPVFNDLEEKEAKNILSVLSTVKKKFQGNKSFKF